MIIGNKEHQAGGKISAEDREAYRTYTDKTSRTTVGTLVANYPVKSLFEVKIFDPHNGYVTANHEVKYTLNDLLVYTRHCQFKMLPDKSECSIKTAEYGFCDSSPNQNTKITTLTFEQFKLLAELWNYKPTTTAPTDNPSK